MGKGFSDKGQGKALGEAYFLTENVLHLAQDLLGKVLVTCIDGERSAVVISETEAYEGPADRASHAYGHRRTRRTETMYLPGGHAYVYLCYGMHHLFNVVSAPAGVPHAVLIRAGQPLEGLPLMLKRRKMDKIEKRLTAGPGSLSRALGISTALDGEKLGGPKIWIEDRGIHFAKEEITAAPRIGVDYAGEHAQWPYRFYLKDNEWVSKR